MKKRQAYKVIAVEENSIIVQLGEKRKSISNNLLEFEALVGDEVWVTFNAKNTIIQVEQKDFSREYALSDEEGEGKTISLFVSPERKLE